MFQMQKNNEDLQIEMQQLKAENEYLRSSKIPVDISDSVSS